MHVFELDCEVARNKFLPPYFLKNTIRQIHEGHSIHMSCQSNDNPKRSNAQVSMDNTENYDTGVPYFLMLMCLLTPLSEVVLNYFRCFFHEKFLHFEH